MRFPLAYDATTSREDFVRLLPLAVGGEDFREIDGKLCGEGWSVRLTQIESLEIGLVRLERHRVEIAFDGLDQAAQDAFMDRFSLYYQRGGG